MSRFSRATTRRRGAAPRQPPTSRRGPDDDLVLAQQAAHGRSTPDRVPPASLLAVQRTVGNAALVSMVRGRPHRSSRTTEPGTQRRAPEHANGDSPIQRAPDLAAPVQRFKLGKTAKRVGKWTGTRVGIPAALAVPGVAFGVNIGGAIPMKGTPGRFQSRIYGPQPRPIPVSELQEAAKWAARELKKNKEQSSTISNLPNGTSEWGATSVLKYMLIELQTYSPTLVPDLVGGMRANSSLDAGAVMQAARAEHQRRQASKQQKKAEEKKQQDPMERIAAAIELLAKGKAAGATGPAKTSGAKATPAPQVPGKGKVGAQAASGSGKADDPTLSQATQEQLEGELKRRKEQLAKDLETFQKERLEEIRAKMAKKKGAVAGS